MTEHDKASLEYLAQAAVFDYANLGPEPGFGDVELTALTEWIDTAEAGLGALSPTDTAHLAWMYVDRSWSRIAEGGYRDVTPPADIAQAIQADLRQAGSLLLAVRTKTTGALQTHADTARLSLPIVGHILTKPDEPFRGRAMAEYLVSLQGDNANAFIRFRHDQRPHTIPNLDASLGLRLLVGHCLETDLTPVLAALRHSRYGPPYNRWQALLYNRGDGSTLKVRFAPQGSPDMFLLPPHVIDHSKVPSKHGRGMLSALVANDAWGLMRRKNTRIGSPPPEPLYITQYRQVIFELDTRLEAHIEAELHRLAEPTPEPTLPADLQAWYTELPPFDDPCHASHGEALDQAIAQLEMQRAEDGQTVDSDYLLANMYLEAGASQQAGLALHNGLLVGSFERAEDIFSAAREAMVEQNSQYYALAIGECTAAMYRALFARESVSEQIDIYCGQLAILASRILNAHAAITDKTNPEAERLAGMIQLITALLVITHTPDKTFVALPATPRQQGGGAVQRGWDYSIWTLDSEDTYLQEHFHSRLEAAEDPRSIDDGVVTVPFKALGQWLPSQKFHTLRTVISVMDPALRTKGQLLKPGDIHKARRRLLEMTHSE